MCDASGELALVELRVGEADGERAKRTSRFTLRDGCDQGRIDAARKKNADRDVRDELRFDGLCDGRAKLRRRATHLHGRQICGRQNGV